jgi:hypothetical protein
VGKRQVESCSIRGQNLTNKYFIFVTASHKLLYCLVQSFLARLCYSPICEFSVVVPNPKKKSLDSTTVRLRSKKIRIFTTSGPYLGLSEFKTVLFLITPKRVKIIFEIWIQIQAKRSGTNGFECVTGNGKNGPIFFFFFLTNLNIKMTDCTVIGSAA